MEHKKEKITTMDAYILQYPTQVQDILEKIRETIHQAVPKATEKISYQMPTFYYYENLVHFAAYERHIGFYPTPSAIEAFRAEIQIYKWAKGSVQFPLNQPIPYELITRMSIYRKEEVERKVSE